MKKSTDNELKNNLIFVGTIYDSFEALEETLGKLKLEKPLFITHIAKLAFAKEVFDCVNNNPDILYKVPRKVQKPTVMPKYYN